MKTLYGLALLILLPLSAFAQWHQLPGPPGGGPYCYDTLAGSNSGRIYAGTEDGVWLTTDHYQTWTRAGLVGRPVIAIANVFVPQQGIIMFCTADKSRLYRSIDSGATWQSVLLDSGQTEIISIIPVGQTVFLVLNTSDSNNSILRSSDLGDHWSHFAAAPPNSGGRFQNSTVVCGGYLFVIANDSKIWKLPLGGGPWEGCSFITWHRPICLATFGNDLFVGGVGTVDVSTDLGLSWMSPVNYALDTNRDVIHSLLVNGLTMIAAATTGVYLSTDGARSWSHVDGQGGYPNYYSAGFTGVTAYGLEFLEGDYIVGEAGGMFKSADGKAWQFVPQNARKTVITDVASSGNNLFATDGVMIARSSDHGATWEAPGDLEGVFLGFHNVLNSLYLCSTRDLLRWSGTSWDALITPDPISSLTCLGDTLIGASSFFNRAYASLDSGKSWQNLSQPPEQSPFQLEATFTFDDALYELLLQGDTAWRLWQSTDAGMSWTLAGRIPASGGSFMAYAVTPSKICLCLSGGIYITTNRGVSWSSIDRYATSAFAIGSKIMLTLYFPGPSGLFVLEDTLTQLLPVSATGLMETFAVDSTMAYIGANPTGLWAAPLSNIPLSVPSHPELIVGQLRIYPNPTASSATISFDLDRHSHVTLRLYDESGAERAIVFDGTLESGHSELSLSMSDLPNGSYILNASGDVKAVGRVVIAR